MQAPQWAPLVRDYEKDRLVSCLDQQQVSLHPLLPKAANRENQVKSSVSQSVRRGSTGSAVVVTTTVYDPLSDPLGGAGGEGVTGDGASSSPLHDDPLMGSSNTAAKSGALNSKKEQNNEVLRQTAQDIHVANLNTPWQIRKQQILKDYIVSGPLTLNTSAINEFAGSGVEDGSTTRYLDKYTQRLQAMERRQVADEKVQMTQQEYEAHINKLSRDLTRAWANDERVASLKIAIQLAKLLADTNMPQFYPSMFVMVTDELDRFGDMVFTRLKGKAEEALNEGSHGTKKKTLPEDFSAADVPSSAKETCRNWFYKTACIRELLPRIYIETTLLKCYRYLTDTDYPQILSRLGSILRGLGDPLVSLYARTYLVVVGNEVAPQVSAHALNMIQDIMCSFKMLKQPHHVSELANRWKISHKEYMRLMSPGIEWVLKCVGRNATREVFQGILQLYRDQCNDATVLKHIIDSFDGSNYSHGALGMSTLIKAAEPSWMSAVSLYAALGAQIAVYPPPEEQRIPLLNDVWKIVSKSDDIAAYVQCSAAWLDCVQRHYSERELLILLSDLKSKLQALKGTQELADGVQRRLETIVSSLIGQSSAYGTAVLTSDHLLKIQDSLTGSRQVSLCKDILESFKSHSTTNDAILINTMFNIGRTLHDSVDCLSPDGETRYISTLLCSFIEKIDFGKDLEQQLNMYVECRAIFCNLDLVKDKLIVCVSGLAVKAYKYMRGKHSKKTSAFAKACLAFCHITIPSISDVVRKLQLLLYCAQVALLNQCLPQTDTFLKAAISLIPDCPAYEEVDCKRVHMEEKLASFVRELLSTLVVAPGHPDHGPFYIVQGLLNALPKFPWQPLTGVQTKVYVDMLALLCTYSQRRFPYRINHVESNDELYGGAPDYMNELAESISKCVSEILRQLTALGERSEALAKLNQAKLILDIVNQLASRMELSQEVCDFCLKLLELSAKNKASFTRADAKYMSNTVDFLKGRISKAGNGATNNAAFVQALKAFG